MKMKALLALGLCFALTAPLLAQENEIKEVDSVYITPFAGAKIILVGKSMEKLLKENNLEVLKNKFIEDYQTSAKDKDFPATAKSIIYLAGADGKRRIKAIPDEVAPVIIKEEIKSFNSNLPPFHYTIYDLMKDYQYHIYVNGPEDLDSLYKISISSAVQSALVRSGYSTRRLKSYTAMSIGSADSSFIFKSISGYTNDLLVITSFTGIGLFNSKPAPLFGFDIDVCFKNKYGRSKQKVGLNLYLSVFADYKNKSFSNFYQLNSYNIHYMVNTSRSAKESWFGITTGLYSSGSLLGGSQGGSLHKAWQFGFSSQISSFGFDFNIIRDRNKEGNSALTLRYYF